MKASLGRTQPSKRNLSPPKLYACSEIDGSFSRTNATLATNDNYSQYDTGSFAYFRESMATKTSDSYILNIIRSFGTIGPAASDLEFRVKGGDTLN